MNASIDYVKWTDIAQTALQSLTLLTTVLGAFFIWLQIRALNATNQADINESLASQSFEIIKYLSSHNGLYEYFYLSKSLDPAVPDLQRIQVLYCAELILNFLEHIVLQKENIPRIARESWMFYVKDSYNQSLVLRQFLDNNKQWYSPALTEFVTRHN